MSTEEVNFDAPVPKAVKPARRKVKAKARKPRATTAPKKGADVPFPGMTRLRCADDCGEKGCVIGVGYCAHPCKGGLQAADQGNRTAMNRLQMAREQLAVKIDPQRFT